MPISRIVTTPWNWFNWFFDVLTPVVDFIIRFWVARAFFLSGLTKIQSWSTTIALFTTEYHVPLLPPEMAAMLSVCVELGVSVLLVLGIFGRIPAFILFVFNIIAVASYPFLWTDEGYVGLKDHISWGLLLLVILAHGTGKLSVDQLAKWISRSRKNT